MKNIDWPLTVMCVSGITWLAGEAVGATDKKKGNTFSEWFKRLPAWVKMVICFVFGGVFVHLIEWRISDDSSVTVEGDVNVEVHKD